MKRILATFAIASALPAASCTLMGKAGINFSGDKTSPGDTSHSDSASADAADHAPTVAPGREAVAQAPVPVVAADGKPSYCQANKTYISSVDDEINRYRRGYHSFEAMHELAISTCEDAKPEKRARIDVHMAKFKEVMGLTDSEVLQVFAIYLDKQTASEEQSAFCKTLEIEDEDLATEKQKAYKVSLENAVGCSGGLGPSSYDWPDQDFVARGLDIAACYRSVNGRLYGGSRQPTPYDMLSYGECNAMAQGFNVDKTLAAVRAEASFNMLAKADFIALLTSIAANRELLDPIFKKYVAKDDIYGQLVYQAPSAAYKQWFTTYKANKELMDEMHYIVGHGSNKYLMKRVGDCSGKYFSRLQSIAKAAKIKSVDDMRDALSEPVNGMAAASYAFCEAAQKREAIAEFYRESAVNFSLPLGPRDAARKAALAVLATNRDDIKGAYDMSTYEGQSFDFPDWRMGSREQRKGIIQSVKKSGQSVLVTFKKESWKEPTYRCHETNKIDGIKDGKLIYRENCKRTGSTTVTKHEQAVEFPARHAAHLKAGQFLVFSRPFDSEPAMPVQVYKSKSQEQLIGMLGLAL